MSQQGILTDATSGASDIETITGDNAVVIGPDVTFNVNLLGTAVQGISTLGAGNTITWTIADASEVQKGVSELATDAETIAGTDTGRTVVPSSLKAKFGAQTIYGLPIGAATTAAINWTAAPTDGQVLIGSTGANPVLSTLSAGEGIAIANSAGGVSIARENYVVVTGQTIGAVTLDIYTLALGATPACYRFEASVVGLAVATSVAVAYGVDGAAWTNGAVAVEIGTEDVDEDEVVAGAAADAAFLVNANTAVLRLTGVAGSTINWRAVIEYVRTE